MTTRQETACPGCTLRMPASDRTYDGSYHTSPECWSVYTEVLGAEFGNAILYGAVHQLTVDSYAVQHAGGDHTDKSIAVHLAGLHLVLDRGMRPPNVPPLLRRLADVIPEWPHFLPPVERGSLTVFDVALTDSVQEHIDTVEGWAKQMWAAWSTHHDAVADLVARQLPMD